MTHTSEYVRKAIDNFSSGLNCSQAVFAAFCDAPGITREAAVKIASGFGGGIGRQAETCGAVTGAVMVIGLKCVPDHPVPRQNQEIYDRVRRFCDTFKQRHGSLLCRELLGCDISTPEGLNILKDKQLTRHLCPGFVSDAVRIVEELLPD